MSDLYGMGVFTTNSASTYEEPGMLRRVMESMRESRERMEFAQYEILADQRFVEYEYKDLKWLLLAGLAERKDGLGKTAFMHSRTLDKLRSMYERPGLGPM